MDITGIENLKITQVSGSVYIAHQINPPYYFSSCDGLIISSDRDALILDLNIEPHLIDKVNEKFGPIRNYVCTHGHMDHIAHVYKWESLGAKIYAPIPDHVCLLNLSNFYERFGWNESVDYKYIQKFAKLNLFQKCAKLNQIVPGKTLNFDDVVVETISLPGHSKGHIGFFLPEQKILHISCLGFDQRKPGIEGFGPWYGFKECSIDQYLKDIDKAEVLFANKAKFLTTSHSYVVKNPDMTPFNYMRRKIKDNQDIVDKNLKESDKDKPITFLTKKLLDLDLFFPKMKMDDFRKEIWSFWESHIINKHLKRSKLLL